jgi:hypothetical protein
MAGSDYLLPVYIADIEIIERPLSVKAGIPIRNVEILGQKGR